MTNRNERMEKLNNAGIDTGKYFTLNVNESIPAGAKIHIVVDDNGNYVPQIIKQDAIAEQIIGDGYVKNTKLHRRFVMAQMFHMLNYVSYDRSESGYNACLKNMYNYQYTLNMMLEEVRVLGKLEKKDTESFAERSHFFTKDVVVSVLNDYVDQLKKYVDTLPSKNCKGVPYKRVKGTNIFVADLEKKLYGPMCAKIREIGKASNYTQMYNLMTWFMKDMVKLPYNTPKSKAWVDAFKGEGAYYTLKNLVMFHDCGIEELYGCPMIYGTKAATYINRKLDAYQGEGWRMFAFMKKVITDNRFDFAKRMGEIYNK